MVHGEKRDCSEEQQVSKEAVILFLIMTAIIAWLVREAFPKHDVAYVMRPIYDTVMPPPSVVLGSEAVLVVRKSDSLRWSGEVRKWRRLYSQLLNSLPADSADSSEFITPPTVTAEKDTIFSTSIKDDRFIDTLRLRYAFPPFNSFNGTSLNRGPYTIRRDSVLVTQYVELKPNFFEKMKYGFYGGTIALSIVAILLLAR